MIPSFRIIKFLLVHHLFAVLHAAPPYQYCPNTTGVAVNTTFDFALEKLFLSLQSNSVKSNFFHTTVEETVHGLFLCYKYVARDDCENCIETASQDIQKLCENSYEAVVWEEMCQLRYSKESLSSGGHLDVAGNIWKDNTQNVSDSDQNRFTMVVNETLQSVSSRAAFNVSSGMYATEEVKFSDTESIYALVQCTPNLSSNDCSICLQTAIQNISSCCSNSRGARLLSPSCFLRYEFYPFYEGASGNPSTHTTSRQKKRILLVVGLSIGSSTFLVTVIFCVCWLAVKYRSQKRERKVSGKKLSSEDFPFFDLQMLNSATDKFSDLNKLGEGGFGPVYKGRLFDGKEVAVKRLSSCSEQGSDEFTNEVVLIMKLQHINLVKLLGFCIDGEEKLLVYEYMPNGSLDTFLFDRRKRAQLDWKGRLNIITGIARGMLYLHEDSRLRIIHRDLKPSNVLLDSEMNPKISDFGMARIFCGPDAEINTAKIVGTYGYMAPEFAMEGLYSVKSDVFSFGVVLLEIITGRRNATSHSANRAPTLLAYAWKLWTEGKAAELIDPLLRESCEVDQFLRYMHIGLLCGQEDAHDRPNMSTVVVMLKSDDIALHQPQQPAFSAGRYTNYYYAENVSTTNDCSVNELTLSGMIPR